MKLTKDMSPMEIFLLLFGNHPNRQNATTLFVSKYLLDHGLGEALNLQTGTSGWTGQYAGYEVRERSDVDFGDDPWILKMAKQEQERSQKRAAFVARLKKGLIPRIDKNKSAAWLEHDSKCICNDTWFGELVNVEAEACPWRIKLIEVHGVKDEVKKEPTSSGPYVSGLSSGERFSR